MHTKARNRYSENAINLVSREKQFLMLYDRLVVDLDSARSAFEEQRLYDIHVTLRHAQDIVHLLMTSLREDIWDGATQLKEVYGYALAQLVKANIEKSLAHFENAESVLRSLHVTWREAARQLGHLGETADGVA